MELTRLIQPPISPFDFYTRRPSTVAHSVPSSPLAVPVSAPRDAEHGPERFDGESTFRRCKALCGEVKTRRPYARYGNVGDAWNEVLNALQEGGFYLGRKIALPTLRDELKELIAFKELMTFEEVSDLLGEPKRVGRGISTNKKLHKVRKFPFSRDMLADTIASSHEFIQNDIRRINEDKEQERGEREKNRDNERDSALILRESAMSSRVTTFPLTESMACSGSGIRSSLDAVDISKLLLVYAVSQLRSAGCGWVSSDNSDTIREL